MTAAQVWDDLTPALGDTLEAELKDMVRAYEASRPRSLQQAVGPSGLGKPCTRCLAREVLGRPVARTFDDPWCRIIGTAVHAWLSEAALYHNITVGEGIYLHDLRVYPAGPESELLPKGGELDLYIKPRRTVVDHKIVSLDRLKSYRVNGPGQQYRYQGHLYGRGLALAGHEVENVAIAFWPRGGTLRQLHVHVEPYDEAVAVEALTRYSNIRDLALAHGVAILPALPADPDCWDCSGADVTPEELL